MSFRSPSPCPLLTGPAVDVLGTDIPLDSLGFQLNSDLSLSPRAAAKISDGSQYYVLLIITDGVISDMTQTKEAIVSVSLRRVRQGGVTVNNCPGVEILPYMQANKSGCQFHECWQWTQTSGSKAKVRGTSLAVQWLRLNTSTAGGMSSIPGRGIEIPHATIPSNSNSSTISIGSGSLSSTSQKIMC